MQAIGRLAVIVFRHYRCRVVIGLHLLGAAHAAHHEFLTNAQVLSL
jgi:hypothetical protein